MDHQQITFITLNKFPLGMHPAMHPAKKLCKTLKQLGLPEKRLPCTDVCLKVEKDLKFDPFKISELFKKFYSNLANDLVRKLPAASKKFDIEAVKDYNNGMFDLFHNKLNFQTVQPNTTLIF